jgi:hypothetical protein
MLSGGNDGGEGACASQSQQVLGYAQERTSVRCSLYESILRRNGMRMASFVVGGVQVTHPSVSPAPFEP